MAATKHPEFDQLLKERMLGELSLRGILSTDSAPPRELGLAFLRLYLNEIFSNIYDLDDDEIEGGIFDKANDLGIDFGLIRDGHVYIIQSKYGKAGGKKEDVSHTAQLGALILGCGDDMLAKGNRDVRAFIKEVRALGAGTIHIRYITNAKVSQELVSEYGKQSESADGQFDIRCDVLGYAQIKQEWVLVASLSDEAPTVVRINISGEDYRQLESVSEAPSEYKAAICTQRGTKIFNLFNSHQERLFNKNIRLWLGRNPVNKAMLDTIKNEPENFFYYNNGITAICESFAEVSDGNEKFLECKGLQIVNGAQTVTTLAREARDNGEVKTALVKTRVLLRIIAGETGKRIHDSEGLNEKIVRYTNTQTVIHPSDFRSNDKIQVFMGRRVETIRLQFTLSTPFKSVFYKRKRRRENPKRDSLAISMQDIAKSYFNFTQDPITLNASTEKLWDSDPKSGLYWKIFGDNQVEADLLSDQKLYALFGSFYIFADIKRRLKGVKSDAQPSVLFKYHILWGIRRLLLRKHSEAQLSEILRRIVTDGEFVNQARNPTSYDKFEIYFSEVCNQIDTMVSIKMGDDAAVVMRNLQRDSKFVETLKAALDKRSQKILPELV